MERGPAPCCNCLYATAVLTAASNLLQSGSGPPYTPPIAPLHDEFVGCRSDVMTAGDLMRLVLIVLHRQALVLRGPAPYYYVTLITWSL